MTIMMMASMNTKNTNNNDTSLVSTSPAANEDDYLPSMAAIQGVDSEDVEDEVRPGQVDGTFFQQLLHRMDPSTCLMPMVESISVVTYKSCVADKREEFEWRLPSMLHEIRNVGKPRTPALQKFYRLVDREHQENRIVAIASSKDTIKVLLLCLKLNANANERRTALLILNNLCIPMENKVAILHGEDFTNLMSALLRLIQARTPTAYLAIVTLVNLSNIHDAAAKRMIFQFIPPATGEDDNVPPDTYRVKTALDEPTSCIRTLESILRDTIQYRNAKNSVEQHCFRWAMNVVRNLVACSLTTEQENGFAVAKHTIIPELAVTCLLDPNQEYAKWTRDSLPDAALMVIVHLAKDDDCVDHWRRNQYLSKQILQACDTIMANATGIHATRAAAIKEQFLENVNDRSVGYSV